MNPEQLILSWLDDSLKTKEQFTRAHVARIAAAAVSVADRVKRGGKVLLFGNGGSAADASHIAAEFVNRFKLDRPAWPAISLCCDPSTVTSIANDRDYNDIFSRQIEAFGGINDVAWGISTSGDSETVVRGLKTARVRGCLTIASLGRDGGKCKGLAEVEFIVPGTETARIQETHLFLAHAICELTELALTQP